MNAEHGSAPEPNRSRRSDSFLKTLEPYRHVVLVTHVNPDPDGLASMLALGELLHRKQPGKSVVITVDGMIARAENQAMVHLLEIPLVPVEQAEMTPETALVMVDSQPHTGRRGSEAVMPLVVIDHHETPGQLDGVRFVDLRPDVGATSTIITGYLLEQQMPISPRLATALLYAIDSETTGYPREACPLDDGAQVWLFPRADKDLLAQIRNTKLPISYFATFHNALSNAFLYQDVVVSWCGAVPQPDIVAELADFFIRFDQVNWVLTVGLFENLVKVSIRVSKVGGHSGEVLREVVDGLGTAGGHDKRAGGAIPIPDPRPEAIDALLRTIRTRLLRRLEISEQDGQRLLEATPMIPVP